MIATLLVTIFAGSAVLAVGTMILSWKNFGYRFSELRAELREANCPVNVRYSWRDVVAARQSATVYNLDFKAKADALPFHPGLRHDLLVAA